MRIAVVQSSSVIAAWLDQLACEGVDVDLSIRDFIDRLHILPAQPEVQGESRSQLNIVLEKQRGAPEAVAPGTCCCTATLGVERVQEEVSIIEARVSAAVSEQFRVRRYCLRNTDSAGIA